MSGRRPVLLRLAVLAPLAFNLLAMPQPAEAGTYVVNAAYDDLLEFRCDARHCSLSEAVAAANLNPGPDTITFDLPGDPPYEIELGRSATINYGPLTIDGRLPGRDQPGVVLRGSDEVTVAITINGVDVTIQGLAFVDFVTAVDQSGERATLANNRFGADLDGVPGGNTNGVVVSSDDAILRSNEFLYNDVGIFLSHAGGTVIQGNTFVDDAAGVGSGNGIAIRINRDSYSTLIGGYEPGQANLISGSRTYGILDESTSPPYLGDIRVIGNFIGTDRTGTRAIPNGTGIYMAPYSGDFSHVFNWNVISGNDIGIQLTGDRHLLGSNRIGANADGTAALGNRIVGVVLDRCHGCRVYDNVISGNPVGLQLAPAHTRGANTDTLIDGNFIGTNQGGMAAIPNEIGIQVGASQDTTIGGGESGAGNVISGNGVGLQLLTDDALVLGNAIGTTLVGGGALPNEIGIELASGGAGVRIGGLSPGDGNQIAFNLEQGILSEGAEQFSVEGNAIHDNGAAGIRLQLDGLRPPAMGSRIRITQNSIYDNDGLGLRVAEASINAGLEPPLLTRSSATSAAGTACAGCRVEVFLAAPDPSGAGEGRTFLAAVTAGADGAFTASFPAQDPCDRLTATAIDGPGNTSEFSENRGVGLCAKVSAPSAMLWILIGAAGGSALGVILRRRPPGWSSLPWAALGGLIGVGLAVVVLMTPNVQVAFPEEGGQEPGPPPGNQPPPQQVPPTVATSTATASVTVTRTPSATETLEPTRTPTPTLGTPQAEAVQNANCRFGPGTVYDVVGYLLEGQSAPIVGRNAEGTWWVVALPDRRQPCWVSGSTVQASGDLGPVQVLAAPPTPTPSPTPEPEGCWVWNANLQQNQCLVPCPDNAQPGGACTP